MVMYIETVPNRNSPPAILLRESYRVESNLRSNRSGQGVAIFGGHRAYDEQCGLRL
jgi:hypothetical protein